MVQVEGMKVSRRWVGGLGFGSEVKDKESRAM